MGDLEDHGVGTTASDLAVTTSKTPTLPTRHLPAARKKSVAGRQN